MHINLLLTVSLKRAIIGSYYVCFNYYEQYSTSNSNQGFPQKVVYMETLFVGFCCSTLDPDVCNGARKKMVL